MMEKPTKLHAPKEFSSGEVILATQLLTKIFEQEMAPLSCVPDADEASLLLRTLNSRTEQIRDDLEAMLDNNSEIQKLIETCDQNCTCSYVDELILEHQVILDKSLARQLKTKNKQKDLNSCLNYVKETFCQGELFLELNKEKVEYSYDHEP